MVTLHILFKVKPSQVTRFDDLFILKLLSESAFRVDAHNSRVQTLEADEHSDRVVQYDLEMESLEMESADLAKFLDNAGSITSHAGFDIIWKQAEALFREEHSANCHLKAFEPHGCKYQKHIKAWTQRHVLLHCNTCKPALKEEIKA